MIDPRDPRQPGYQRELGFVPCRAEGCARDNVHPWHPVRQSNNGRVPRTCPMCLSKIVREGDDARCTGCPWIYEPPTRRSKRNRIKRW